MSYADFEYYSNTFYDVLRTPPIPNTERESYLEKATAYLNSIFGSKRPTEEQLEAVKKCCCDVADCFYIEFGTENIASENNDGYSVTYTHRQSANNKAYAIVLRYLSGTGLLYRGICSC